MKSLKERLEEKIECDAENGGSYHMHSYKAGAYSLLPLVVELANALEFVTKNEPADGGPGACTYCDMGGAGYSSKGDRHHDDLRNVCPVVKCEEALQSIEKFIEGK